MSEKRTYKLVSDQDRAHCIDEIARAPLGKVVIVQDPFMGSGTTAAVALQHGRQYLGCELNAEYGALQAERINEAAEAAACAAAQPGLFERAS